MLVLIFLCGYGYIFQWQKVFWKSSVYKVSSRLSLRVRLQHREILENREKLQGFSQWSGNESKRMPAFQENVCNPYASCHQFLQSLSSKSFGKRREFGIRLTRALCYLLDLTEDHHSVHPPSPLSVWWVGVDGGWTSYRIFKKRGLYRTSVFRGGCW